MTRCSASCPPLGTSMRRREFLGLIGGAAVTRPLAARAQHLGGMKRVGVLIPLTADDPESQRRVTAFVQGLQELGWTDGRNVRIDIRWTAGDADRMRRYAVELFALAPDVILASGGTVVAALLQASRTAPIVFTLTPDPVGAGFVPSHRRRAVCIADIPNLGLWPQCRRLEQRQHLPAPAGRHHRGS
jgi:ABC-type uncharacterized transport system substrate-binding protein